MSVNPAGATGAALECGSAEDKHSAPSGPAEPTSASQSEAADAMASGANAALAAIALLARLHHVAAEPAALRHALGLGTSDTLTRDEQRTTLLLAAKHLGLKAKSIHSTVERLALLPLPALATMADGRVVVLAQCDGQRVLFMDPAAASEAEAGAPGKAARPTIEPVTEFVAQWSGELILVTSRASLAGALAKFDFSWFIPSVVKHRKLLGEVLLVSALCTVEDYLTHRGRLPRQTYPVPVIALNRLLPFE